MKERVQIFHAGDDPEDRAFAEAIARQLVEFAEPVLMDIDELDRQDDRGSDRPEGFRGTPIYVLSPSLLNKSWNRHKLAGSIPLLGRPGWRGFHICRGISVCQVLHNYPDLEELLDKVMIGAEEDTPEMIAELKEFLPKKRQIQNRERIRAVKVLVWNQVRLLGYPLYLLHCVAVPIGVILLVTLLIGARVSGWWDIAASCLCLYSAGFLLNTLSAMDLWPWLGRRWILPQQALDVDFSTHFGAKMAHTWMEVLCLAEPRLGERHSVCSANSLRLVVRAWLGAARRASALRAWLFLSLAIPSLAALTYAVRFWPVVAGGAFLAGFLAPGLNYRATSTVETYVCQLFGLSKAALNRSDEALGLDTQDVGLPEPLGRQASRIIAAQSLESWRVRRRWFPRKDRIFISYAWADERHSPVAEVLARSLDSLGYKYFLDKRMILGHFSAWRGEVSRELLECTHMFVIIGPEAAQGRVMGREIRLAFHRWQTELYPAVICVVHSEVAQRLAVDEKLPFPFWLILRWCPQIGYEQAHRPELLAHLIRQRRRQGLFRDWLAVLEPTRWINYLLSAEMASQRDAGVL